VIRRRTKYIFSDSVDFCTCDIQTQNIAKDYNLIQPAASGFFMAKI
jgi:hypothetical protein